MQEQLRYEILESLPTYGPMHITVSEKEGHFYSEGFVVRFFKSDGSSWVANFEPGWTNFRLVADFVAENRIIVIADGKGYLMDPDKHEPLKIFGIDVKEAITTSDNKIVLIDDIYVRILEIDGTVWESEIISWDGIKDVKVQDHILTGLSYDVTDSTNEWIPFSVDLKTKEITGGSYRRYPIASS